MKFLPVVPSLFPILFKDIIFNIPNESNQIFLSFDDGPHTDSTPLILDTLYKYDVKATFFCLGKHIANYPQMKEKMLSQGHSIANHGYEHLNGWTSPNNVYFDDFHKGKEISRSTLFRPPYGRIGIQQYLKIKSHTRIVMWSIMPGDFSLQLSAVECADIILKNVKSGDIIVLHDSPEFVDKTLSILHQSLPILKDRAFKFECISASIKP